MRIPDDIQWVKALLEEAERTGRPIEFHGLSGWKVTRLHAFDAGKDRYRVQPAPPEPKYRPMNDDELMQVLYQQTIVSADNPYRRGKLIGTLGHTDDEFLIAGYQIKNDSLRYANPSDPRYGQPLQVEIKD